MTKTRDKYAWAIGSPPPLIDAHSLVKHELVANYLTSYIRVLLANPRIERLTLSIVDGFAGGGEYRAQNGRDIHDGSPLITLRSVTETEALLNLGRTKPRRVDAEFFLVEKERSNFDYLRACLGAKYSQARLSTDIHMFHGTFAKNAEEIIRRIRARRGGERALFLLDQYAYDQVPLSILRLIFTSLAGAEVLLTFNVDSLITFLSDQEHSQRKLTEIGLARHVDWKVLKDLKAEGPLWRQQIQRQLARGIIEESGARYSTIFYVTPAGASSWTYWLVHLSKVFKARDVMMELHWSLANHFTHFLEPDIFTLGHTAGGGPKRSTQQDLDFPEEFRFDNLAAGRCEHGLREKLPRIVRANGPMRFADLLASLGNTTPATARMIRDALNPSVQTGDVEARTDSGTRREKGSTIRSLDVLSPSPQQPLIFVPGLGGDGE